MGLTAVHTEIFYLGLELFEIRLCLLLL